MTVEEEHPAARYEADVNKARRRATATMAALGLTAALRVLGVCALLWRISLLHDAQAGAPAPLATLERSDMLVRYEAISELPLLIVTGILFLFWLHLTVRLTKGLGGDTLRWTPQDAVWGFIIPFISFLRPYHVVRDVNDQLAPDLVPEPPMQVRPEGYRGVEFRPPPSPVKLPHASIGAWWAAFWVGNVLANIASRQDARTVDALITQDTLNSVSDGVDIASAVLAIVVVRAVSARLLERFRRVRYNTVEVLEREGVALR
jgi:hypothetical protein